MYNPPQGIHTCLDYYVLRGEPVIAKPANFERIGIVARWQPVHKGHTPVLRALCTRSKHALIGIGSSNKHDLRNPFTLEQRMTMLQLALKDWENYSLIPVPDLDDGPRWRVLVKELFTSVDIFVTQNPYVSSLLSEDFTLVRPIELIPKDQQIPIDGSMVRQAMASNEDWQEFVPEEIADYICSNHLDVRFRQEFGLQTLALKTILK
jgi:nicotinamide-nucleotide adenylyltransferase